MSLRQFWTISNIPETLVFTAREAIEMIQKKPDRRRLRKLIPLFRHPHLLLFNNLNNIFAICLAISCLVDSGQF